MSKKAVIVISSHVVRGSVGNRAAVFALEATGHPVWALQTITLPWHPGHGPSTRIVPDNAQFSAVIDDLCRAPWLKEVGGIISGYLGDGQQAEHIARLVQAVKDVSPEALYLCDPVIGDRGGLYVSEDIALSIKQKLLPLANILTPNRFELAWLVQKEFSDNDDIQNSLIDFEDKHVLVTSAFSTKSTHMANLIWSKDECLLAEHPSYTELINGPGDLTSAILMSHLMESEPMETVLRATTSSVYEILERTIRKGNNELLLEESVSSLLEPKAAVEIMSIPVDK